MRRPGLDPLTAEAVRNATRIGWDIGQVAQQENVLHPDMVTGSSLNANFYGRKKITLIPALQVPNLYNDKGVFSEVYNPDDPIEKEKFKLLEKSSKLEYILNAGESIFIPVGWWHYVESLDVSISLTLTNLNAENGVFSRDFTRA